MRFWFSILLFCFTCFTGQAQDLEPRSYANLPKGLNAINVLYSFSRGNVITDASLAISDFKIDVHSLGASYFKTFQLANKLARVQVIVPFAFMSGNLKINGADTSGERTGFGDARIRLGLNLIGSPALDKKEFAVFRQKTIVGISLVTSVPTGIYYKERRINIGSHRWAFKPEVGVSRKFERLYAEAYAGVWFFTNNQQFLTSKTLEQRPVFSLQIHLCYYFKNQVWVGLDGNWFNGGETIVDNTPAGDLKDNYRIGATLSVPLSIRHSLKFQFHVGAFTNTGYDYDVASIGYQYVFFK
jgi:hypothetical protein